MIDEYIQNILNRSVFPITIDFVEGYAESFGISKRELFAAMAMIGKAEEMMCSSDIEGLAGSAVMLADALIEKLNESCQNQ